MFSRCTIAIALVGAWSACSFDGGSLSGDAPDAMRDLPTDDAGIDAAVDAVPSPDATSVAACHSSFDDMSIGANKYRVLTNRMSHSEAETNCSVDGGRLVVIDGQAELDAINTYLRNQDVGGGDCPNAGTQPCAWIGLSQGAGPTFPGDAWQWIDGSTVPFGFGWDFGEPNDLDLFESGEEDCAQLLTSSVFPGFNDRSCDAELPAICECHSL